MGLNGSGAGEGAGQGAVYGASLGSIVPGVGTVLGGAIGGVVGGIAGAFKKKKKKKVDPLLELRLRQQAATEAATQRALATQSRALPLVAKSFDATRANLANAAERAKRKIDPLLNPVIGQNQANAVGLGASSLAPMVPQGQRRETARAYQEIDNILAQQFSPLAQQQSVAEASILGNNASLQLQGLHEQNSVTDQLAQAYMRPKRRKKNLWDLIGAAAPIIGGASSRPVAYGNTGEGDDGGP